MCISLTQVKKISRKLSEIQLPFCVTTLGLHQDSIKKIDVS